MCHCRMCAALWQPHLFGCSRLLINAWRAPLLCHSQEVKCARMAGASALHPKRICALARAPTPGQITTTVAHVGRYAHLVRPDLACTQCCVINQQASTRAEGLWSAHNAAMCSCRPSSTHWHCLADIHLTLAAVTCAGSTCQSGHCACPTGGQLNSTANCGSCGYVCPSGKCIHQDMDSRSGLSA
jgi:hypothetical protein